MSQVSLGTLHSKKHNLLNTCSTWHVNIDEPDAQTAWEVKHEPAAIAAEELSNSIDNDWYARHGSA